MDEEYKLLMANGTWELTPIPKNRTSIGYKWVFRAKRDAMSDVVRYKARPVAKEFSQIEGVDFHETYSLVAKFITIRCIFGVGQLWISKCMKWM